MLWGDAPGGGRNRLRCATSILSLGLLLNVDGITATTGSTAPIAKVRFKEWAEVWKHCVIQGKGFLDMKISWSYEAFRQRCELSVAFDNSDYM